jgi:hypothetical protein
MTDNVSDELDVNEAPAAPRSVSEAVAAMSPEQAASFRLLKLAGVHLFVWVLVMGLFAAADSWQMLSDFNFASLLSVITGALAGVVTSSLIHEWFHYLGARRSGGDYTIPENLGVFVYDWNFRNNSLAQFHTMSIAGSVGGAVSIVLVWMMLPADTIGRAALHAGVIAGFVFGVWVEWPVLKRTRAGGDPMTELSKIDQGVLTGAFGAASLAGLVILLMYMP